MFHTERKEEKDQEKGAGDGEGQGVDGEEEDGLLQQHQQQQTPAITAQTVDGAVIGNHQQYCHVLHHSGSHPPVHHSHQYMHHHHRFEPRQHRANSINNERQRQLQQQQRHLAVLVKDPENGLCPPASFHPSYQHNTYHYQQQHSSRHPAHSPHRYNHSAGLLPKNKRRHRWFTNCFNGENNNRVDGSAFSWNGATRMGQPRLVDKDGECIIRPSHLRGSFNICMRNWFHLIIEHSWRRIFSLFAGGFICSWLGFGLLYYLIQHFSGDLQNLSEQHQCIANVHSLTSAFLFSLESQHTIGYGTRYMTDTCPLAYAVLSLQCIVGVLLQTILSGIVIAKILRPKKRKQEMRFSKYAVIGPVSDEDQRPALMIRLADIQHRLYIAESHVRLYMATTKINKQGECELLGVQDMNVGYDTGMDRVLLLWPIVIRHIIDEDSPLWEITEEKLKTCQFELLMTVEGIVEATGMAFQARTSFLPYEILWGQHFVPLITLNPSSNQYEVDYDLFDVTKPHSVEPWLPLEEGDDFHEERHQNDRQQEEQTAPEEAEEAMLVGTIKLSMISELDTTNGGGDNKQPEGIKHLPNGYLMEVPQTPALMPTIPVAASAQQQQQNHYQKYANRRKSACSIAESIRSMSSAGGGGIIANNNSMGTANKFHTSVNMAATTSNEDSELIMGEGTNRLPAPRKNSRSSLLHLLLRRTQTNDSSPLMAKKKSDGTVGVDNADGGDEEEEEGGGDGTTTTMDDDLMIGDNSGTTLLHAPPSSPFVVHTLQHSGFT